jgi:hypothetical protein
MTREQALAANRVLGAIEALEDFMDEVEKIFEHYPEIRNDVHGLVMIPLKVELNRRNQELAEM